MPERFDLVVRGGEVANHAGRGLADVGVRDGRIAAIGDLSQAKAGQVFDATGLAVMPGVIDTHVHFREPGLEWKEDLESGSRAAVLGGVTSVFEMPNTEPTTTGAEAFADKIARAAGRMHCDHAFYVGATGQNARDLGELERLPGCSGVKVFMGSSTGTLLVADDLDLREVLAHGRRRVAVHSEDECCLTEGRSLVRIGVWASHPFARGAACAIKGTERLLALAAETGRRVHVLHVTTAEEIELLGRHKDLVTCEVTPQHLTLEAPEAYERLQGRAQMNPPIRDGRHQAGLWRGIAGGGGGYAGLRPRATHAGRKGPALSGLALRHARGADPGSGDADPRGRGPADPGAVHRPDQRRAAAGVQHRRQGSPGGGL